jgi:hypothetical protein
LPDDDPERRAERLLRDISLGDWSVLIDGSADDLDDVYASGLAEGLRLTNMGVDLDRVNARAVDWARQSAAAMVTQIEETTRDLLRATVTTAVEEGWSAARLADEIAQSPAFDADRAMMIARTEIIMANNQGNARGYRDAKASGVKVMKQWFSANDNLVCEVCQDNVDDGPIELEEDFSSGDPEPPAHPNDRCALAPYLPDEDEKEE